MLLKCSFDHLLESLFRPLPVGPEQLPYDFYAAQRGHLSNACVYCGTPGWLQTNTAQCGHHSPTPREIKYSHLAVPPLFVGLLATTQWFKFNPVQWQLDLVALSQVMCSIKRPIRQILLCDRSKEVMAIAATSLMRPKFFGPKATGLDRFHCTSFLVSFCQQYCREHPNCTHACQLQQSLHAANRYTDTTS